MLTKSHFKVLVALAVTALLGYFGIRVYYYFALSYGAIDRILALALLVGEGHAIQHAFGFMLDVFKLQLPKRSIKKAKLKLDSLPSVAILVPIRDEPKEIVERTLIALYSLDYANKKIYVLDGSREPVCTHKDRYTARKYFFSYFHSSKPSHSKAQTINRYLHRFKEKYLVIFDVDQNPLANFITETVAVAEANDKIAFVQTPQLYSNIDVSPIAKGAAMQQSIFYESICEAKGSENAMFCCGTNVLIRTDVLKEVGGFDENSVTEDFSTSVDMHALGYRSVYLNRVLAFGMAPESLPAYLKQQTRWASGNTGVLRKLLSRLWHAPKSLSLAQWWEYSLSSSYYFVGWAFFVLMICPILFLLLNVPSYFIQMKIYLMTFLPYYVMSTMLFYATMKKRHYAPSSIVDGIIMSSLVFPVFMSATFSGLFNRKTDFLVTPKGKGGRLSFWQLWPWNTMILLNAIAIIAGFFSPNLLSYPVLINMVWCMYHITILINIYRFNKQPNFSTKPSYAR